MLQKYSTCGKKQDQLDIVDDQKYVLAKLGENMIKRINSSISDLKGEFLILKEILIKRLQEENRKLQSKRNKLEEVVFNLEKNLNNPNQCGRRNTKNYQGRNTSRRSINRRNIRTISQKRGQRKELEERRL